jgi:hypothetical protein
VAAVPTEPQDGTLHVVVHDLIRLQRRASAAAPTEALDGAPSQHELSQLRRLSSRWRTVKQQGLAREPGGSSLSSRVVHRARTAQQPAQQPGAAPAQHPASLSLSQVEHNLNSLYNRNEMLPWTCRNRIGTGTARAQKCVSYIRFHDFWNLFHSMKSDMKS